MEFITRTINDLCLKITDGAHNSPVDEPGGIYPMYSSKDMLYADFDTQNIKKISEDVYRKLVKQDCRPLKNDILIIKDGNSYLKYAFKVKEDLDAVILSSIAILRPDTSVIDPDYFAYALRTKSIRDAMANYVSGAAIPRIVLKDFKKMKLKLFANINDQTLVASKLMQIDKLIDNNDKRIKILNDMGEELYKEWFIRFRYPGHENDTLCDSRIGKIPSTFKLLKMKDVFEFYIGGGWGSEDANKDYPDGAYVIRGADFPYVMQGDLSTCPFRYHKKQNLKARKLQEGDIIIEISGGTAEQPVGRTVVIDKSILNRFDAPVMCASFCKLIRLNKSMIEPYYFYYWMQFLYDTRVIDRYQLQSTGIINFKFEYFQNKGDLLIPPTELMNKFSEVIGKLTHEKSLLAEKNRLLITLRDLLLPRFMSGKIEVK